MNNLIRPLPDVYPISSNFGLRRHPIHNINGWHNGVDIAAPNGTNIRSAGDGEVIWEGNNESYGNMIVVEHPDGKLSLYAHTQETNVKTGDKVKTGDSIGKVWNTGHSKGNHLHYEVIDGNRQDNGIKIKDRIKWTNNFKYGINSKKPLGIGPSVPRENPKNHFNKRYYIWRTMQDDKVRSSHAKFEGQIFSYDDKLFPGEDYNCRCWAEEISDEKALR